MLPSRVGSTLLATQPEEISPFVSLSGAWQPTRKYRSHGTRDVSVFKLTTTTHRICLGTRQAVQEEPDPLECGHGWFQFGFAF